MLTKALSFCRSPLTVANNDRRQNLHRRRRFPTSNLSAPVTLNPNRPPATPLPMSPIPHRMRMRPDRPMAGSPYPAASPDPHAGHPGIFRPRRHSDHLGLRRRWNLSRRRRFWRNLRLRGRRRDYQGRRRSRHRLPYINYPALNASRE
jgi:hypothetical protein